jgi:hypothetical protein
MHLREILFHPIHIKVNVKACRAKQMSTLLELDGMS